jgi:hypothetical protein
MKDEDIDQRHAAAYHVAGQAVMAFYLGGWVNDEGVEIWKLSAATLRNSTHRASVFSAGAN